MPEKLGKEAAVFALNLAKMSSSGDRLGCISSGINRTERKRESCSMFRLFLTAILRVS
jgi:hypothetical protein